MVPQNLLEQRAGPIGAARKLVRNLLEQRAGGRKPIGAARRWFSQVIDFLAFSDFFPSLSF
jgi:hypothetical protein